MYYEQKSCHFQFLTPSKNYKLYINTFLIRFQMLNGPVHWIVIFVIKYSNLILKLKTFSIILKVEFLVIIYWYNMFIFSIKGNELSSFKIVPNFDFICALMSNFVVYIYLVISFWLNTNIKFKYVLLWLASFKLTCPQNYFLV